MTFGEKLKMIRTEANLTQKALADQLFVAYQTVSKWENGTTEPDLATLKNLAKVLNCSVDDLLSSDEEQVIDNKDNKKNESDNNQSTPVVIVKKELHQCKWCKKEIPEDELVIREEPRIRKVGDKVYKVIVNNYYHQKCLEEYEEMERKLEEE